MAERDFDFPCICDGGHEFSVPISGPCEEQIPIACPVCGETGTIEPDQVREFRDEIDRVAAAALEDFGKRLNDGIAKDLRGLKGVKYTPKR